MCGGIGSRFWPYSRQSLPKQFIDFFGTGRSLLQMTYDRILPLVAKENILVVTNADYAPVVREQLPDLADSQLLLEPARRNTAPCIAWAARHVQALDPEASMIVTPSDHLLTNERVFQESVRHGFEFVESHDSLLTLGIRPTRPETGYGYIQIGKEVEPGILKVKTFTEKPDLELAKVFVDSGEFFWNAGIFLWSVKSISEEFENLAPDLSREFDKGDGVFGTPGETDFAIMEKASNVYVECVDFGWSDLGTWSALYDNSPKTREGNVTQKCSVMTYNSRGNIFAVRDEKLVVVSGLENYIVADAGDVLLICPMKEEQDIKRMVNDVKERFDDKYL